MVSGAGGASGAGVAGPLVTGVAAGGVAAATGAEVVDTVAGAASLAGIRLPLEPSGVAERRLRSWPDLALPPPVTGLSAPLPFPGFPPPFTFPVVRVADPSLTGLAILAGAAAGAPAARSPFATAAKGAPTATAKQAEQAVSNRRLEGPTSEERGPQARM
jgi:hypothetical protein